MIVMSLYNVYQCIPLFNDFKRLLLFHLFGIFLFFFSHKWTL